jgi:hypothetical protein
MRSSFSALAVTPCGIAFWLRQSSPRTKFMTRAIVEEPAKCEKVPPVEQTLDGPRKPITARFQIVLFCRWLATTEMS